jgi:hypothetical protein
LPDFRVLSRDPVAVRMIAERSLPKAVEEWLGKPGLLCS